MKLLSGILSLAILIPALVIACACCPPAQADDTLRIEKAPCHSCCPETVEIARDCGTLKETPGLHAESHSDDLVRAASNHMEASLPVQEASDASLLNASPPVSSALLSTALRI